MADPNHPSPEDTTGNILPFYRSYTPMDLEISPEARDAIKQAKAQFEAAQQATRIAHERLQATITTVVAMTGEGVLNVDKVDLKRLDESILVIQEKENGQDQSD